MGIKKGKISNPAVLEDIITNTEGLIYKDYGTPVEMLIKSFLSTDKVMKFLHEYDISKTIKKENIHNADIYNLTDAQELKRIAENNNFINNNMASKSL